MDLICTAFLVRLSWVKFARMDFFCNQSLTFEKHEPGSQGKAMRTVGTTNLRLPLQLGTNSKATLKRASTVKPYLIKPAPRLKTRHAQDEVASEACGDQFEQRSARSTDGPQDPGDHHGHYHSAIFPTSSSLKCRARSASVGPHPFPFDILEEGLVDDLHYRNSHHQIQRGFCQNRLTPKPRSQLFPRAFSPARAHSGYCTDKKRLRCFREPE